MAISIYREQKRYYQTTTLINRSHLCLHLQKGLSILACINLTLGCELGADSVFTIACHLQVLARVYMGTIDDKRFAVFETFRQVEVAPISDSFTYLLELTYDGFLTVKHTTTALSFLVTVLINFDFLLIIFGQRFLFLRLHVVHDLLDNTGLEDVGDIDSLGQLSDKRTLTHAVSPTDQDDKWHTFLVKLGHHLVS